MEIAEPQSRIETVDVHYIVEQSNKDAEDWYRLNNRTFDHEQSAAHYAAGYHEAIANRYDFRVVRVTITHEVLGPERVAV